jgi:hypothetical protein
MLIYSTKRMGYVGACLSFPVCIGMLIPFLQSFPKRLTASSGSTFVFGVLGGALVLAFLVIWLYAAFKVFKPTVVEGVIEKTKGEFVSRAGNNLVICLDGKQYRLPQDRDVCAKLNSVPTHVLRVRIQVGAFRYVLSLETQ